MRSLLLALPLLSSCLVLDADATDPPDPPPPRVDEDCPPPDPGRMMVCGRVVDLVETLRVHTPLRVSFYDATAYVLAGEPGDRPEPLLVTETDIGGRFRSVVGDERGVVPPTAFVYVVVDDLGDDDDWIATSVYLEAAAGTSAEVLAFATPRASVFAAHEARGAVVPIFIDHSLPPYVPFGGTPRAGVQATVADQVTPDSDVYFDDEDPFERQLLGTGAATGANGTAIVSSDVVTSHSGMAPGCSWPQLLSASTPGTISVVVFDGWC